MRQRIENNQETKFTKKSLSHFGADDSLCLRLCRLLRLSMQDASCLRRGWFSFASALALPSLRDIAAYANFSPLLIPGRPFASHEKISLDGALARSAGFGSQATPNWRSQDAAANPLISITEQRRCVAA
jgi:hypothetical protein